MGLTRAQIEIVFGRPCRVEDGPIPSDVPGSQHLIAPCGCEFRNTGQTYYLGLACEAIHQSLYLGATMASKMRLSDLDRLL
jgi:hypothetical protein